MEEWLHHEKCLEILGQATAERYHRNIPAAHSELLPMPSTGFFKKQRQLCVMLESLPLQFHKDRDNCTRNCRPSIYVPGIDEKRECLAVLPTPASSCILSFHIVVSVYLTQSRKCKQLV